MKNKKIFSVVLVSLFSICCFSGFSNEAAAKSVNNTNTVKNGYEIEFDYLHPLSFKNRRIDTYNLHVLKSFKTISIGRVHDVDVYRGITISRPIGDLTENGSDWDSNAVGLGYTYLLRKSRPINNKVSLAVDASGALMLYNRAFPATGRAYNFMWRIGPRVIYSFNKSNAMTLGWTFMHVSNGWGTKNPSYNGGGITVGYNHAF